MTDTQVRRGAKASITHPTEPQEIQGSLKYHSPWASVSTYMPTSIPVQTHTTGSCFVAQVGPTFPGSWEGNLAGIVPDLVYSEMFVGSRLLLRLEMVLVWNTILDATVTATHRTQAAHLWRCAHGPLTIYSCTYTLLRPLSHDP